MLLAYGLLMLALLGRVEPFKFSHRQPQAAEAETAGLGADEYRSPLMPFQAAPGYYQPPQAHAAQIEQQQQQTEQHAEQPLAGAKGGAERAQPAPQLARPMLFQPPDALAYVIIRPIHSYRYQYSSYPYHQYQYQYQYPRPALPFASSELYAPQAPAMPLFSPAQYQQSQYQETFARDTGIKGGSAGELPAEQAPIKGELAGEQPPQAPVQQQQDIQAGLYKGSGKLMKLKNSLQQLAAQAKSKITLGSTYHYAGEQLMQPEPAPAPPAAVPSGGVKGEQSPPPPPPPQQQQVQEPPQVQQQIEQQQQPIEQQQQQQNQDDIQLTSQEQESIRQEQEKSPVQQEPQQLAADQNDGFRREATRLAAPQQQQYAPKQIR